MSQKKIPYGYCHCGCGRKTKIATRNYWANGTISGEPYKYIRGHTHVREAGPETPDGYKWCGKCKTTKPINEFFKNASESDGYQSHCKVCVQENYYDYIKKNRDKEKLYSLRNRLKKKFGMTHEQYQAILDSQDGKCAICGGYDIISPITNLRRVLAVDHNHATGKIRGLLCRNCNRGIGLLGDNIERLEVAIAYLKKHSE